MDLSSTALPAAGVRHPTGRNDYPRISLLSLGHLTNDLYGNLITSLMPYLVIQGRITATLAGLILLMYLFGSSILQPIFGHMSDSSGRRLFVVLGPVWIGVATAFVGWAPNAAILFALAGIGGIGTAAFHPQAASMVDRISPTNKGWSMSIFSMGGNLGFALGPIAAALIALAGLHWTPMVLIPGIALTILLAWYAPHLGRRPAGVKGPNLRRLFMQAWRQLSLIVMVIALRGAVQFALIIFLPLYYHSRGGSAEMGSYYAAVLSLSGAAGGLIGGRLSDRFGRKPIVVGTLIATAPLLTLSFLAPGALVWPLLIASGALLLASNSVTVVQGQELLPGATGIASGLTLGFGFGLSGVFASALAAYSDHAGVNTAIFLIPVLVLGAAFFAAMVPNRTVPAI